LLIAVILFKKIGSSAGKLCKLEFKLESKSNHWPVANSTRFWKCRNSAEMLKFGGSS